MGSVTGKFEIVSSNNVDNYLKAFGTGMIQRQLYGKAKPTVEVTENNGKYTVKILTANKNAEATFVPDVQFDEDMIDGRKATSTVTVAGAEMRFERKVGDYAGTATLTSPDDDSLTINYQAGGVTATEVYRRL